MSQFPQALTDASRPITDVVADEDSQLMIQKLSEKGFELSVGLTKEYAEAIIAMALEPGIQEYCPNDCSKRFKDMSAVQAWLGKQRATFLLLQRTEQGLQLAGYGWAGAETSEHVPGGETTFAIRVGERGQGQGLATPFAQLIVSGSRQLYGAQHFWLETWQSNGGAVHVYHKLGFEDVAMVTSERSTLAGGTVPDTRIFMRLPE